MASRVFSVASQTASCGRPSTSPAVGWAGGTTATTQKRISRYERQAGCLARVHGTISAARRQGQGEAPSWRRQEMHIIAVSNDTVRLSFLMALLRDAGIGSVVLDQHVSVMEGSIGAIPRRLAVAAEDAGQADRVLPEAGEKCPPPAAPCL